MTNNGFIGIRLPQELKERLQKEAAESGVTLSKYLVGLLEGKALGADSRRSVHDTN